MALELKFGGKSKLHGRTMMYPARISYVPCSEEGLEEYIFAYKSKPLRIEHSTEEPVNEGDFLTPLTKEADLNPGLDFGSIYPVVKVSLPSIRLEEGRPGRWQFHLDAGKYGVAIAYTKLAFAIPGPLTEPDLYRGAEVEVNEIGEVVLHHKDLGVKVILGTIAADDRFREEYPELVAQNELFVINDV